SPSTALSGARSRLNAGCSFQMRLKIVFCRGEKKTPRVAPIAAIIPAITLTTAPEMTGPMAFSAGFFLPGFDAFAILTHRLKRDNTEIYDIWDKCRTVVTVKSFSRPDV